MVTYSGIAPHLSALIALRIPQRVRLASRREFNVSSTVPRTSRSRWPLIRSSSIRIKLLSGPGTGYGLISQSPEDPESGPPVFNQLCEMLCTSSAKELSEQPNRFSDGFTDSDFRRHT